MHIRMRLMKEQSEDFGGWKGHVLPYSNPSDVLGSIPPLEAMALGTCNSAGRPSIDSSTTSIPPIDASKEIVADFVSASWLNRP